MNRGKRDSTLSDALVVSIFAMMAPFKGYFTTLFDQIHSWGYICIVSQLLK